MDRFYYEIEEPMMNNILIYSTSTSEVVMNYLKLLSGKYYPAEPPSRVTDIYMLDGDLEKIVEFCKLIGVEVVGLPLSSNLRVFYAKIKDYEDSLK